MPLSPPNQPLPQSNLPLSLRSPSRSVIGPRLSLPGRLLPPLRQKPWLTSPQQSPANLPQSVTDLPLL
jgi:hypothetical protein